MEVICLGIGISGFVEFGFKLRFYYMGGYLFLKVENWVWFFVCLGFWVSGCFCVWYVFVFYDWVGEWG